MITLHLKKGEIHSQHAFTKERIVIGSSQQADIIIDDVEIEAEHLLLVKEGSGYKAINTANDPFVSLNTLPFGKRTLREGDLLSLHSLALQIHYLQESQIPPVEDYAKIKAEAAPQEEEEEEEEEEELPVDFLTPPTSLRASPQEIEELLEHFIPPQQKATQEILKPPFPQKELLPQKRGTPYLMWIIVWMMFATVFYLYLATQQRITPLEEREAARGVSDVAMTLLYAKMNHFEPSKIDWNSSSSLRRLSRNVLYPRYTYAVRSEGYDHLVVGRHTIEVYYSENGEHFFVVARPQSPFWPTWWKNTPSIALDSTDMRLRKVEEIEAYADLLNKNTYLKQENDQQLTSMFNKEQLLPLSSLAQEGHTEFRLPLILEERREEGNFVYNLPRYSPFTDLLLEKIIIRKRRIGGAVDGRYDEQLKNTLKLKDLVLYTTQDLNKVIDSLQGFVPEGRSLQVVKIGSDGKAVAALTLHSLHEEIPAIEE